MDKLIEVKAFWDPEAKVWVAESEDVPGLVTEADSVDTLVEKLKMLIPELLEENGLSTDGGEVPFKLVSEIKTVSYPQAA